MWISNLKFAEIHQFGLQRLWSELLGTTIKSGHGPVASTVLKNCPRIAEFLLLIMGNCVKVRRNQENLYIYVCMNLSSLKFHTQEGTKRTFWTIQSAKTP